MQIQFNWEKKKRQNQYLEFQFDFINKIFQKKLFISFGSLCLIIHLWVCVQNVSDSWCFFFNRYYRIWRPCIMINFTKTKEIVCNVLADRMVCPGVCSQLFVFKTMIEFKRPLPILVFCYSFAFIKFTLFVILCSLFFHHLFWLNLIHCETPSSVIYWIRCSCFIVFMFVFVFVCVFV